MVGSELRMDSTLFEYVRHVRCIHKNINQKGIES